MIQPQTLAFLEDLRRNNYREWFNENRPRYDEARADILNLTSTLIERINEFDPDIGYPDPAKCLFRIYRDTRFSPDKTPYKDHFGIFINEDGVTKSLLSGYYLHISPGGSFISAGLYMMPSPLVQAVRREIDGNWETFSALVKDPGLVKEFGGLNRTDGKILTRVPRGFDPDSPAAEYLKLTNFFIEKGMPDEWLTTPASLEEALRMMRIMKPLQDFWNEIVKGWEGR